MDEMPERFLQRLVPAVEESETWGDIPLRVAAYLAAEEPPPLYVTSVRGLVFRDSSVLVLWDDRDQPQLLPGGRCEPGESFEQTLFREVLEETGIAVHRLTVLGFLHYRHLGPKPPGYAYPYPDFLQVIYLASAGEDRPEAMIYDEYVTRSAFLPLAEAQALPLRLHDRTFLTAAMSQLFGYQG